MFRKRIIGWGWPPLLSQTYVSWSLSSLKKVSYQSPVGMRFFVFISFSLFLLLVFGEDPRLGVTEWTTSMLLPGEHSLKRNWLLGTLPILTKEWRVSFEFKPNSYNHNGNAQVLQLTIGGKSTSIGDRTPALWITKKNGVVKVVVATTLNGKASLSKVSNELPPAINEWTNFEISQERKGSDYIFTLVMKDKTLWSTKNTKPQEFSNLKVYASSKWYVAQSGYIRGLKIENKIQGKRFRIIS